MFVLAQERHPGATKLQSWLVSSKIVCYEPLFKVLTLSKDGVFDALSKNVLASLQFSIILDKKKPSEIIESYTFTMKYTKDPEASSRQLVGLTISSSGGEPMTLIDVRIDLKRIWKHLSHIVEKLPELPRRVHRFHNRYILSDFS